jgi:hypothetical protein
MNFSVRRHDARATVPQRCNIPAGSRRPATEAGRDKTQTSSFEIHKLPLPDLSPFLTRTRARTLSHLCINVYCGRSLYGCRSQEFCNHKQSQAITSNHKPSQAITSNHKQSQAITSNHKQSQAITSNHKPSDRADCKVYTRALVSYGLLFACVPTNGP